MKPDSRVTMHQIAREAGVSLGTVSHVINEKIAVSEPLRRRVLDAIASLGYKPNEVSRALRMRKSSIIGVIIPDITNPFFPGVVRGIEDVAYKGSYRLVLCNTDNDARKESSYMGQLMSFLPAGIIIIPSTGSTISSQASGPPIVFVDRRTEGWKGDCVLVANRQGAYRAAQHLIEMGHTRVAVISGPSSLTNARERLKGFCEAFEDAGIGIQPEYIQEARFDRESGLTAALRLLKLMPRPTAIFATNDLMGMGALLAIRELQLKCPNDVSLVSFDGLDVTELTDPPLTTVYQPGYQLGFTAARLLLERIRGSAEEPKEIVLGTELRIRNSVRPITSEPA